MKEDYIDINFSQINLEPFGVCEFHILANEGNIPHFHITNDNIDISFCLYSPEYYNTGTRISDDNLRTIYDHLQSYICLTNLIHIRATHWSYLCRLWKFANPNEDYNEKHEWSKTIPNYTLANSIYDQYGPVMYDASKDPNYRDDIVIGKIDFGKRLGVYEIHIYGKEHYFPHFHMINEIGIDIGIQLYKNRYYYNPCGIVLSKDECEILDNFMSAMLDNNGTIWNKCCKYWRDTNPNNTYCNHLKKKKLNNKPNYKKLKDE